MKAMLMMKLKITTLAKTAMDLGILSRVCRKDMIRSNIGAIAMLMASRSGLKRLPKTAYSPTCTATNLAHWPGASGDSPVFSEKEPQAMEVRIPTLMLETKP
eukprot:CAMPEP_0167829140 /NCGR_PEP_ID=MMETSP0112_2-20121227/11952_1 /TAXON_ID=91324 /ORGANISM="Lotharella globosa, Strain CCCM811" /LENGTH=101 /DNA_ID=CAMNT_0007732717 /DNA_START=267 /DNA_END=572 /DNA_ORIENTATION=-